MFNSLRHNQLPQQYQPILVQGLNVSNPQPSLNPLNPHLTYQQQHQPQQQQQQKPQTVQGSTIPNLHSNVNPLDLYTMYQQKFQKQ